VYFVNCRPICTKLR